MAFGGLKRRADLLAAEGARLQEERNARARRSLSLLRERIATPEALAACFTVGFLVATPKRSRARAGRRGKKHAEGRTGRALAGALGPVALRLASSLLAGGSAGSGPGVAPRA